MVARIDKYKAESSITTKNGRNHAIAQLIELGLAIAPLLPQIERYQRDAQIDSLEEAIVCLLLAGLYEL
ncbi:MAG: hypothetical protein ACRC62_02205 [Microcoleus sp.]